MEPARTTASLDTSGYRHEALFYAGLDAFIRATTPFLREGVRRGEPTLVVTSMSKIERLRDALGRDANAVGFADMAEVGANPARIIPAWRDFVSDHAVGGRRVRGIGEPVWAGRPADDLVEAERHEALLNVAFGPSTPLSLLCPYDVTALETDVLQEARRNHPYLAADGAAGRSPVYRGPAEAARPFDRPLPEPSAPPEVLAFDLASVSEVRALVRRRTTGSGLASARSEELLIAVNEIAANSVRHGGGAGILRVWEEHDRLICEIRDAGRIDDPLAGRRPPNRDRESGFGLWIATQLCDLIQIRSSAEGSIVRLHMHTGGRSG